VAEDAGLMTDLGNWAIKRACQQAAILPAHITMAVNVSPSQFRSASILVKLRRVLEETRLDPKRLILEVTETAILTDEALAEKLLREIQALGVGIALDDFGTGFSSLSYLQRFPFNKVKIDRSFVAGILDLPANLAVIRAVLGIGRDLGISVVAEGVETRLQVDALVQEGCKIMQGYFYGKPKPYTEIVNDLSVAELAALNPRAPETKIRLVR
jgi:EAL domain-containing protein (putative c-di-GMP-specific phosphodiesterase class I)